MVLDESYFNVPANLNNFARHSRYDQRKGKNLSQRLETRG